MGVELFIKSFHFLNIFVRSDIISSSPSSIKLFDLPLKSRQKLQSVVCTFVHYVLYVHLTSAVAARLVTAMATIAPFSTSVQTHCALVVCDSESLTVALHSAFLKSTEAVTELFSIDSCHVTHDFLDFLTESYADYLVSTLFN